MHDPKEIHLQAVHRILHYLKANPRKGISFKRNSELVVEAYMDADYAGSLMDRRSTSGYCTFLGGNLITWQSKKLWHGQVQRQNLGQWHKVFVSCYG